MFSSVKLPLNDPEILRSDFELFPFNFSGLPNLITKALEILYRFSPSATMLSGGRIAERMAVRWKFLDSVLRTGTLSCLLASRNNSASKLLISALGNSNSILELGCCSGLNLARVNPELEPQGPKVRHYAVQTI